MKKFFHATILTALVCVAVFVSGCGFFSVDSEEIIETIAEQQLYYDNDSAKKMAKSVVLHSNVFMLQGFKPYFAGGSLCFLSSKKLLYTRIKDSLFYLSVFGCVDYDELKKICAKLANLQEKSTYKVTQIENPNWEYRQRGYEAYILTFNHPDMKQIAERVESGIRADFKNTHDIDLKAVGDSRSGEEGSLYYDLRKLYETTADPAVLKKYGDTIVKNFSAVLDDKIPFKTREVHVYIKSTGKEIDDLDEYVMPDGEGDKVVYFSSIMWGGFNNKLGLRGTHSLIHKYDIELEDFTSNYSKVYHLNEQDPEFMNKFKQIAVQLKKAFNEQFRAQLKNASDDPLRAKLEAALIGNTINDVNSLEKFLDVKERLDEELIALAATVPHPVPNQPKQSPFMPNATLPPVQQQPTPTPPTNQPVQQQPTPTPPTNQPVQQQPTAPNLLNNTEFGLVFGNYYRAISEHRFADAYSCLTENCRSRQGSLEDFANSRQSVLSVEILDFQQTAASATNVAASYQIRTKDKLPGGVKVQVFSGNVNLIKTGDRWLIDSLSSTLIESHTE